MRIHCSRTDWTKDNVLTVCSRKYQTEALAELTCSLRPDEGRDSEMWNGDVAGRVSYGLRPQVSVWSALARLGRPRHHIPFGGLHLLVRWTGSA